MKTCSLTALAALVLLASSPTVPAQDLPPDTVMTALAEGKFPKVPLGPPPTAPGPYAKPNFPLKSWEKYFVNLGGPEAVIKWGDRYHKDQGRGRERAAGNRRYIINWAPLGIRTVMHNQVWTHQYTGFPQLLATPPIPLDRYKNHKFLTCSAFEVLEVLKGSPAEGRLKKGDLLIEMDGQRFKTAVTLGKDYGWPLYKRNLEVHAGELLDAAEGRGQVTFKVLSVSDPNDAKKVETLRGQRDWWTLAAERKRPAAGEESKTPDPTIKFRVRGGDIVWPFLDGKMWTTAVLVGKDKRISLQPEGPEAAFFATRRGSYVFVPDGEWVGHNLRTDTGEKERGTSEEGP